MSSEAERNAIEFEITTPKSKEIIEIVIKSSIRVKALFFTD